MSVKQDRVAARTVTDLERKYSFGKTFAEMQGLIDDSRDRVSEVEDKVASLDGNSSTSVSRDDVAVMIQAERGYTDSEIGKVYQSIDKVRETAELKVTADKVQATVKAELKNGVELEVGYSFTADGLDISKTGDTVANKLDNTGMFVTRNDEEILTANKDGVVATDLHAKTFLKIGSEDGRCRFEDYDTNPEYGVNRVGCFWIGG